MYSILIIEDDKIIRDELKILLEKYGYMAIIADDFSSIVSVALEIKPHLILLDLNLPVYDGYHICREIRKESSVPIIVVTSRDNEIDELMSMNLGADDFVSKPYNTQILLARISALINRAYGNSDTNILRYKDLELNTTKGIVSCENKNAILSKNEIQILALLIKSKGNITTRNEIMNELWQSDEFVDDNTLTVNINRLRKRLAEIGKEDILKTKRGQGYVLN